MSKKDIEETVNKIFYGNRTTGEVFKYINIEDIKKNLEKCEKVEIHVKYFDNNDFIVGVKNDFNKCLIYNIIHNDCDEQIRNDFIKSWKHLINDKPDSEFKYNQINRFTNIDANFNIFDSLIFIKRWLSTLNDKNLLDEDMNIIIKFGEELGKLEDPCNVSEDFKLLTSNVIYLIGNKLSGSEIKPNSELEIVNIDSIEEIHNICYNKIIKYNDKLNELYSDYGRKCFIENKFKNEKIIYYSESNIENEIDKLLFEIGYEYFIIDKTSTNSIYYTDIINKILADSLLSNDKLVKLINIFKTHCKFINLKNLKYEEKYSKSKSFADNTCDLVNKLNINDSKLDTLSLSKLTDLKNKINKILENQTK